MMDEKKAIDTNPSERDQSDLSDVDSDTGDRPESILQPDLVVAKDENRWVWGLRVLVAFVLLSATIAVCLVVYFQGRQDEQEAFEKDFVGLADKLVVSFESVVQQRFGAIDLFFSDVTANANQSWPFVTPPAFTRRMSELHKMAGLSFSLFLMKVEEEDRSEWESYTVANQGSWRREGMAFLTGEDPEDIVLTPSLSNIMYIDSDSYFPMMDTGPGPYFPIWMQHPLLDQSSVNVNMYRDAEHAGVMDYVVANKRPGFGPSIDYIDPNAPRDPRYSVLKSTPNLNYQDDPYAVAEFPVYDKLGGEDRSVAAILYSAIYWRTYFDGLLPKGADGIYVVLENTCGQQFTYQVDGLTSRFVSHGDIHSPEYDYLERETSIDLIFDFDQGTTAEGEDPTCHYSFRVYPSDEFRARYETNEPWLFAVILAAVFVFTAAVFILYDCMVERRQKAVMKSAQQSGKIVHSLFPEAVRNQLYEEQDAANKAATWETSDRYAEGIVNNKQAIAKEYPETTIFFADLVGFTKWSATRTPAEVFQLLEALYGAFDAVANKKGVFKVETIGDCYVAVAGLPEPQEKHAEIMVKFSIECLTKMRNVVASLVDTLGDDTANLAMRVGLHSGPVTGGVLRGQKSRFQLFGDTVNTASRMESNGTSGMIHVSESTAEALTKLGRSSWLVARDRKLPVKGKGEMQTYFVQTRTMTASTARVSAMS